MDVVAEKSTADSANKDVGADGDRNEEAGSNGVDASEVGDCSASSENQH